MELSKIGAVVFSEIKTEIKSRYYNVSFAYDTTLQEAITQEGFNVPFIIIGGVGTEANRINADGRVAVYNVRLNIDIYADKNSVAYDLANIIENVVKDFRFYQATGIFTNNIELTAPEQTNIEGRELINVRITITGIKNA